MTCSARIEHPVWTAANNLHRKTELHAAANIGVLCRATHAQQGQVSEYSARTMQTTRAFASAHRSSQASALTLPRPSCRRCLSSAAAPTGPSARYDPLPCSALACIEQLQANILIAHVVTLVRTCHTNPTTGRNASPLAFNPPCHCL